MLVKDYLQKCSICSVLLFIQKKCKCLLSALEGKPLKSLTIQMDMAKILSETVSLLIKL